MDASGVNTGGAALRVSWGINRWVLVETPAGSVQRQVGKRSELAALLVEAGLAREEAERTAAELWRERPADARFGSPSEDEAPWFSTGLPTWAIFAILLGIVALYVLFRLSLG